PRYRNWVFSISATESAALLSAGDPGSPAASERPPSIVTPAAIAASVANPVTNFRIAILLSESHPDVPGHQRNARAQSVHVISALRLAHCEHAFISMLRP